MTVTRVIGSKSKSFSVNLFICITATRSIIMQATHNFPLSLCPDEPSPDYSFQSQLMVPNQVVNADSSPETSPIRPLPRSASTANLQSASKLILSSKLVYSKRLDLPHGVEVTRATPSAGWDRFHTFDSLQVKMCKNPFFFRLTLVLLQGILTLL